MKRTPIINEVLEQAQKRIQEEIAKCQEVIDAGAKPIPSLMVANDIHDVHKKMEYVEMHHQFLVDRIQGGKYSTKQVTKAYTEKLDLEYQLRDIQNLCREQIRCR